MNELDKYRDNIVDYKPAAWQAPPEPSSPSASQLIVSVLRRWYITLSVFVVICAVGVPAIWLLSSPTYEVIGAVRVAPTSLNILTGESDKGEISNYQSFVNTQAEMITSSQVIQRVADDLADKNLTFFDSRADNAVTKLKRQLKQIPPNRDPEIILKEAISQGLINAAPLRGTYLLQVVMRSPNPEEARQIVNAFIAAYMAVEVSASAQEQDKDLGLLENERRVLEQKLRSQHDAIRELAQEYGTDALSGRRTMMLQQVIALRAEVTKVQARRIGLETQVELLEQTDQQPISPEQLLVMRNQHISSDPTVIESTKTVVALEQQFIIAQQQLAPSNPTLKQKEELLEIFKSRLEQQRQRAGQDFDQMTADLLPKVGREKLAKAREELKQARAYEDRLRGVLAKEDDQTRQIGHRQLDIGDLKFDVALDEEYLDTVRRRIREMEIERKQPARISVANKADVTAMQDERIKYTMALAFVAAAGGMLLALMRDKADLSLRSPEDVTRRIGIRILGTTTSPKSVRKALIPRQLNEDYQSIRANLGLLNGEGMPQKIAVTSPGMREGKTTFAINLATSLAGSGKKVLLIDGDLRKPDVGRLLHLPRGSRGLQEVLFGKNGDSLICTIRSKGLDVLVCDSRNATDAFELLTLPLTAQHIDLVCRDYDHVIIDTPPVLAFPDALIWAKIAGAVVLTCFAGQTIAPDLKQAKDKLAELNVKVLGTVLANVAVTHSYYRYGYSYYSQNGRSRRSARAAKKLLLPMQTPKKNS
jgi:capsular exopolysaccharide synthesis family protein